jgi:PUA domain protein
MINNQKYSSAHSENGHFIRWAGFSSRMQVKSRHHLRSDAISSLQESLAAAFGSELAGDSYELVELSDTEFDVVLVDGEQLVAYLDDEPFLTVQGANEYQPTRSVVTVDAGAVSFVSNGADVMRPGIVEADDNIESGDLVAIAEETHGKVLGIGRALEDSENMVGDSGKVVESIHHVGDDLYTFSV